MATKSHMNEPQRQKNVDPYRKKIPRGKGTAQELLAVTSHRGLTALHETPEFGTK